MYLSCIICPNPISTKTISTKSFSSLLSSFFWIFLYSADIETNNNNYRYEVIGSLPNLESFNFKLRDKREVSVDNKPAAPVSVSSPSGSSATPTKPNDGNQTQSITLENDSKRLLGVNGTGQRLNITFTAPKPAIVSEPLNPEPDGTKPIKGLTSIKSMATPNTTATSTTMASDFDDQIIDSVDTPEENINKTIRDNNLNVTYKDDYYQYYNSTTLVDKEKSEKYWADLTNFTTSSLLSKSHRRAIVRIHLNDFQRYPIIF